jgi:ribosome-associated heat shock protein Hsp15
LRRWQIFAKNFDRSGTAVSPERAIARYHKRRMLGIRIDKWLWAARFFKTRTLAAKACELGRIRSAHQPVRASRGVHVGDLLSIATDGGTHEVEVLGLSEVRGPAPAAHALYRETESSREARRRFAEERKAGLHFSPAPLGRPSKKDRRRIIQFRSGA